ncbi:gamma-secretase subunit Aph-1 [Copidosoma floridanum]|uniref:gamma-secretase subunit Aph-1 n=1 Tax=Copidosoma floridanum TaxID=29053 RepID=UPI000C6F7C1D|nr:gamma-secretase subunit Aph-1 [Copidosoma floridanum]
MTVMDFFGCALLAFGPPLTMFTFTIAVEPIRIIILIASTFFWLISLLLSSMLWYMITPLQKYLWTGILYSVTLQEIFRYLLYTVMRKAEKGLEKVTTAHVSESRDVFAYVCGLGFGVMSGAFALVNVLADAIGPGTMGLYQGNEYFFLISAATTLCFILLHTFWGIIFFSACDEKNWFQVTWVVTSHMFVSFMTILNSYQLYAASLFTVYTILLVNTVFAFNVAGGRVQTLLQCLIKK